MTSVFERKVKVEHTISYFEGKTGNSPELAKFWFITEYQEYKWSNPMSIGK